MSEITVGRIELVKTRPHVYRVIKAKDRNETPEAKRQRLDIAMLKILVPAYPELARELVEASVK